MSTAIASIITYVALNLGLPCKQVFIDTVLLDRPSAAKEMDQLREFAETACRTDNPDLVWQVAYVESDFRFVMASINHKDGNGELLTGDRALKFLTRLKKTQAKVNVDIGVIQMNWPAQRKGFAQNPLAMMSPKNQVTYLVDNLVGDLVKKCGTNWVGCYHSYKNRERSRAYFKKVESSGKRLKSLSMTVLDLRKREAAGQGPGHGSVNRTRITANRGPQNTEPKSGGD